MADSAAPSQAILDLLVKQVTEGLSAEERHELDDLDRDVASAYVEELERAVAAINLAARSERIDSLSPALMARIERDAQRFFNEASPATDPPADSASRPRTVGRSQSSLVGWYAAAACLVLAGIGWFRSAPTPNSPPPAHVKLTMPPVVTQPLKDLPPSTPAEERERLLTIPESVKVTLSASNDPAARGVSADVVWDPLTQRGFLRILGLKTNDPAIEQYQAWIFDARRDKRYPLSAALFNVPANAAEVIVPIQASLPVHEAKAFAVTLETPGGVVVPGLKHVVALGPPG